jgi:thiol:disulfide interchange protein
MYLANIKFIMSLFMKRFPIIIAIFFTAIVLSMPAYAISAEDLPKYSQVYDEQSDPFKDAGAAIKLAKETNRNVLIEIGGNWCGWCKKMDAFLLKNPDVYKKLHDEFVLLKVSVSDSNENEPFMKSLPPVLGYPHMYVSTSSGKMVLSKDTAELLKDDEYSKEQWLAFLTKWQASATQG